MDKYGGVILNTAHTEAKGELLLLQEVCKFVNINNDGRNGTLHVHFFLQKKKKDI